MPCDSRTTIKAAYTAQGLKHLLRAAERLGWKVQHAESDGSLVVVESPAGAIQLTPGRCDTVATQEAGRLLQEYARSTFEEMVESNPDIYEQVREDEDSATYLVKGR